MSEFRKLRTDQKWWLHAKLSLTVWAVLLFFFTPLPVERALGLFISSAIGVVTAAGVGLSIYGLIRSRGPELKHVRKGIALEMSGLWIAIAGPASYAVTQFFLELNEGATTRIPQIAIFYTICAFLAVRLSIVRAYRKKLGR